MKFLIILVVIIAAAVVLDLRQESTVYACSDPDIPADVKKRCPKPTPRWEDGCIIREVHGREFKACG